MVDEMNRNRIRRAVDLALTAQTLMHMDAYVTVGYVGRDAMHVFAMPADHHAQGRVVGVSGRGVTLATEQGRVSLDWIQVRGIGTYNAI